MALTKSLLGSASQWLSTVCYAGIKWTEFKELFMHRFGDIETPASIISGILNSQPKRNESLSVFGSRIVTTLLSSWKNVNMEQIAVSLALAHIASVDKRLTRTLFTTKIATRNELQQELQAYSYGRGIERNDSDTCSEAKRIKLAAPVRCHFCGKLGHKIAECKARMRSESMGPQRMSQPAAKDNATITCYKCGQPGHISTRCSAKSPLGELTRKPVVEKRVNMCAVDVCGALEQSGEKFPFYFDNGSQCSLVKNEIAKKFSGRRYNCFVTLRGIGDGTVISTLQILSVVKIQNYNIEILFHVVPESAIKYKIIIGADILALGYTITLDISEIKVCKSKTVYACSTIDKFNLENIDTDLNGEQTLKLRELLQNYKTNFIQGIPNSRITTGECVIRLVDNTKTVQRRPYRLGDQEREIVRNKIKELLDANIIRPSASPFASPILLVKKKDGSDRMCVDYRELNANTIADRYPLPLISDQIARLKGANYFTCLDMASGYHQVPMSLNSIEYTAFVTPDSQYEYLTMPFGLKNAPSIFQRAVTRALGDLVYSFVIVYMDDIMVMASTENEAFDRLKIVLDTLKTSGFSFNIKKCSFLKNLRGVFRIRGKVRRNQT